MAYCHDILLIHYFFSPDFQRTYSFLGSKIKGQYHFRVINCTNVLEAPDELALQFVHRNPA